MRVRITVEQRNAILRAAKDAERFAGQMHGKHRFDAVDVACETNNFWWQGIGDYASRIGLRLISMQLDRGFRS